MNDEVVPAMKWLLVLASVCFVWTWYRRTIVKTPIRNLPGPKSDSWFRGNLGRLFHITAHSFHKEVATYGGAVKIHSLFGGEQVYFSDPRALHTIVVKDQYVFEETAAFLEINRLLFGTGLLSTLGEHHKRQRKLLNPVFSINHMRNLTPLFYDISHELRRVLVDKVKNGEKTIDVLNWMSRVALEIVGQGGLGYSFDALDETKENEYSESIKNLLPTLFQLAAFRPFVPYMVKIGPSAFRRKMVDIIPSRKLQKMKQMVDLMDRTSRQVLEAKTNALAKGDEAVVNQIGQGKDIISVLLRANQSASEEDRLSEEEVLGQMSSLIFAAHDTTSSALARILHLLALHPDLQDRLRAEITEARAAHGDLAYDELAALPYLEAVVRETLRVHPPVTFAARTARKAAVVPLLRPVKGTDGQMIHEVPIAENQTVLIGLAAANKDPYTWGPDADEWKPERWLSPLPESVKEARVPGVYSNLMTFLGGGRACIGFKFSQLEAKTVLSLLIEKFKFALPDEEIVWKMGSIQTPSLKGKEYETPHLPLKVSLV